MTEIVANLEKAGTEVSLMEVPEHQWVLYKEEGDYGSKIIGYMAGNVDNSRIRKKSLGVERIFVGIDLTEMLPVVSILTDDSKVATMVSSVELIAQVENTSKSNSEFFLIGNSFVASIGEWSGIELEDEEDTVVVGFTNELSWETPGTDNIFGIKDFTSAVGIDKLTVNYTI